MLVALFGSVYQGMHVSLNVKHCENFVVRTQERIREKHISELLKTMTRTFRADFFLQKAVLSLVRPFE